MDFTTHTLVNAFMNIKFHLTPLLHKKKKERERERKEMVVVLPASFSSKAVWILWKPR